MVEDRITTIDITVQKTHEWINAVADELKITNRQEAFRALRSVLQTLRDELDPPEVAQLASQLTPLMTGYFYEGWKPGRAHRTKSAEAFLERVMERHGARPHRSPEDMVTGVANVLQRHVSDAELKQVMDRLPDSVWKLFKARTITV